MGADTAVSAVRRLPGLRARSCWLKAALFYLLVPVLLAVEQGVSESGSFSFVAKRYYFYYFLAATLPLWWAMDIMSRFAQWILRPWQPPLWSILFIGAVFALNIQATWSPLRQSLFEPYLAEGSSFFEVFPWRYGDPDYLLEAVLAWLVGGGVWVATNFFFLRVLGFPRLGHRADADAREAPEECSRNGDAARRSRDVYAGAAEELLFDKLPEALGRSVVALKAEEHYTRVYTDRGEALILMRFRDAVELLEYLGGVQVHRSYWVNPRFAARVRRDGRNTSVELSTGLVVPISRSYRVSATQALGA